MPLLVDGEIMDDDEIRDLLRMVNHDTAELAGSFYEMKRSEHFRDHWKKMGEAIGKSAQDAYIACEWKHFHEAVKFYYTDTLNIESEIYEKREHIRDRRHKALILINMQSQAKEAKTVLQVHPGTQQFEGDKTENKRISDEYGDAATIH